MRHASAPRLIDRHAAVPTYDYLCTVCGHREETVHGIHGLGPTACPVCGGLMRKAVAAPAVHYKGSGWAKKDRGAARTKAAAKADASGDGSSEAPSKTTDDGAPASSEDKAAPAAKSSTPSDRPPAKPSPPASAEAD
ncbi:MAG: hypothetical protein M3P84_11535, partial [Chloroflexota bacterium]|nr:hypothetical protein [Chloroflexota bacterium]